MTEFNEKIDLDETQNCGCGCSQPAPEEADCCHAEDCCDEEFKTSFFDDEAEEGNEGCKTEFKAQFKEQFRETTEKVKEKAGHYKEKAEGYADHYKEKLEDCVDFDKLDGLWQEAKTCLNKPVEVCRINDKKVEVPMGIAAIAATGILYPLHKSKTLVGASALAVGTWYMTKRGGLNKAKRVIDRVEKEFAFDFANMSDIYGEVDIPTPQPQAEAEGCSCGCKEQKGAASAFKTPGGEAAAEQKEDSYIDLAFTTKQNLDKNSDCC